MHGDGYGNGELQLSRHLERKRGDNQFLGAAYRQRDRGPFEGNEVDIFVYATSAQDTSKRGDTGVDVLLPEAQLYPTSRAASLAFGNQSVDTTSTAQAVTLVNLGPGVLTISSIAASANFGQIEQLREQPRGRHRIGDQWGMHDQRDLLTHGDRSAHRHPGCHRQQ